MWVVFTPHAVVVVVLRSFGGGGKSVQRQWVGLHAQSKEWNPPIQNKLCTSKQCRHAGRRRREEAEKESL